MAAAILVSGCAHLGFTDRVLLHVPSPDGQMIAVCQEVPVFDGPDFAVRLERRDGEVLRTLYPAGDGDPCDEIAWAPDGRTLAVLSTAVARIRFVDVAWALEHPSVDTARVGWREVSLADERHMMMGTALHFTDRLAVGLQLCPYDLKTVQRTGTLACAGPASQRTVAIPEPILAAQW